MTANMSKSTKTAFARARSGLGRPLQGGNGLRDESEQMAMRGEVKAHRGKFRVVQVDGRIGRKMMKYEICIHENKNQTTHTHTCFSNFF